MSFISDTVSKMMGAGTGEEYRKVALDEFCNANGLSNLSIEQVYRLDPSRRTTRFKKQVLFCRATKQNQQVALVIGYDEDLGYTEGALINLRDLIRHRALADEYKKGSAYASTFFNYVVIELGVEQSLGIEENNENTADTELSDSSFESDSKLQNTAEKIIVSCPSCHGRNRVPADGNHPKSGRVQCGHCSFVWQIVTSEPKATTYKMELIKEDRGMYVVRDRSFSTIEQAKRHIDDIRGSA